MKKLTAILSILSVSCFASDLDHKLDSLNIPSDRVSPQVSQENIISVTGRYSPLKLRHELSLVGGNDFSTDGHIETQKVGAKYRFHINSKFSVGAFYSEYENKLSSAGEKLFKDERILPDTDYAIKSADAFISYNTVYGKLRLTEKQIVYFDHYVSLGYGHIDLAAGETNLYSLDTGVAFWIGKHASFRAALRSEFYRRNALTQNKNIQSNLGYLEVGFLL